MYTIKNTSSKIIHIAGTVLLPDQEMKTGEKIAKASSVQAFEKHNMLKITAPKAKTPEKKEETESEQDENDEQAPAEPNKGTRRTTRKAADSAE